MKANALWGWDLIALALFTLSVSGGSAVKSAMPNIAAAHHVFVNVSTVSQLDNAVNHPANAPTCANAAIHPTSTTPTPSAAPISATPTAIAESGSRLPLADERHARHLRTQPVSESLLLALRRL